MIRPQLSGWCCTPQTVNPEESHARCQRMGGGNTARPSKEFQPCPCYCHLGEQYECGGCGLTIAEAPSLGLDEDGDTRYVHIDHKGYMIAEECARASERGF